MKKSVENGRRHKRTSKDYFWRLVAEAKFVNVEKIEAMSEPLLTLRKDPSYI
ncbi:MAG: hypothetical protein OEV57_00775 [Dehalococcoidia bacterium]|nr:hypothetical protein [Dehalococcoidia bacterium]